MTILNIIYPFDYDYFEYYLQYLRNIIIIYL